MSVRYSTSYVAFLLYVSLLCKSKYILPNLHDNTICHFFFFSYPQCKSNDYLVHCPVTRYFFKLSKISFVHFLKAQITMLYLHLRIFQQKGFFLTWKYFLNSDRLTCTQNVISHYGILPTDKKHKTVFFKMSCH